jgi:hypothetical protein
MAPLQVGAHSVLSVHDNGRCGITSIRDVIHIANPVDEVVALIPARRQVDHCSFQIGKSPLSRRRYPVTGVLVMVR